MHTRRRILLLLGTLVVTALVAAILFWPRPGPATAEGVVAIDAGFTHTCAVTTEGGAECWGRNDYGELGDGTTAMRTTPVGVVGLGGDIAAVAAGGHHTCALTPAGGVKCWGGNSYGQLGDGQTCGFACTSPADVSGLTSGVAAVAAGHLHTCAVTTEGGAKCWGTNNSGWLGDGTTTDRSTPVEVVGLGSGVAAVAAGWNHTCALTAGGGLKCWGLNDDGQLGAVTTDLCGGAFACSTTPLDVAGLTSGVAAVAVGTFHTCALTTAGGVKCWGANGFGQLGDGQACGLACTSPVDVSGLTSGVAAVAVGDYHGCALTTAGGVKCWGRNSTGQLGDGTGGNFGDRSTTPVDAAGLEASVGAIAAGFHTCAVTTEGGAKCWGFNSSGQLGDGTTTQRTIPVDVVGVKATPTPCGPEGCPTPTSPATATPTPTPTVPAGLPGDVGCDGIVNSLDALAILQFDAGLVGSLACQQNADVNGDGDVNSLDAVLILQYDAGLIGSLPP